MLKMIIQANKKNIEILQEVKLIPISVEANIKVQTKKRIDPISDKLDNSGFLKDLNKDFCNCKKVKNGNEIANIFITPLICSFL